MSKTKRLGQVFTPNSIVERMLHMSRFISLPLESKILEPSFGEGAFLLPLFNYTIIKARCKGKTDEEIISILKNIYGVEIDKELFVSTIAKIKCLLFEHNLPDITNELNLFNEDFLDFKETNFDYIVGNPPYVRIHNIDEDTRTKIKDYKFSTGNTDLYIIFFEKCINLLNKTGKLIFITPNSYLKNSSQKTFRNFLTDNKLLRKVLDFGSTKVFENADTYTAITYLKKDIKKDVFTYEQTDGKITILKRYVPFDSKNWFAQETSKNTLGDICQAQYGFATNADKVFIADSFDELEQEILRDIVKGSRIDSEKIQKVIFPYKKVDDRYVAYTEDELKEKFPKTYAYLLSNKKLLEKRSLEKNTSWFEFARSQSIQTVDAEKLVIKQIIASDEIKITFKEIPAGTCVYSGLYITANDFTKIKEIISTQAFCTYLKDCGKDMSGGYKSFNTKLIKKYSY